MASALYLEGLIISRDLMKNYLANQLVIDYLIFSYMR